MEADVTSIEGSMRRAIAVVTGAVQDINKQEVNWTSILTRTVTPAIIGSIAAQFALAIANFTQFQNAAMNLNNVVGPATKGFSGSVADLGDKTFDLANTAGVSLGDATSAFQQFAKAGLDTTAAYKATIEAAGIARTTGQSLGEVTTELVALFENWGIHTLPQVEDALTGLANAASQGQFTFQELVSTISDKGAELSGKTDIKNVALQLAALSTQSGMTKTSIIDDFNTIANASADPLNRMNLLVGDMSKYITSGPDGLITAFSAIKAHIDAWGPAVRATLGAEIGLSAADVRQFEHTTKDAFTNAAATTDLMRSHLTDLNTLIEKNTTALEKLNMQWNRFQNNIIAGIEMMSKVPQNGFMSPPSSIAGGTGPGGFSAPSTIGNIKQAGATFNNIFNISGVADSSKTSDSIAKKLYDQFQGIGI